MSNLRSSSRVRANGTPPIPAAFKKMVDSLKEIVNCPDHEIYAMLKECNMDPNDTVSRLLSQDPFHEVKSKREKKKENKDSSEVKSRVVSSSSNRGGRSGADRNSGRSDSGGLRNRSAFKKENGGVFHSSAPTASAVAGSAAANRRPISISDSLPIESTGLVLSTDMPPLPSQPSSGYQPAWIAVPGQVSMADIVKRGKPQGKPASMPFSNPLQQNVNRPSVSAPLPLESYPDLSLSQRHASEVPDVSHEPVVAATGKSVGDPSNVSAAYADPSSTSDLLENSNFGLNSQSNEVHKSDGSVTVENLAGVSASERQIQTEDSYHSQGLRFEEGNRGSSHISTSDYPVPSTVEDASIAVSSTASSLQQLSLQNEDIGPSPSAAEDNPAVIIPNHLQVPSADFSHLSFGSFGSGVNVTFSGPFPPKSMKNELEESKLAAETTSIEHQDVSNEYYGNDHLRSVSNENADSPSSSQPEIVQHNSAPEPAHGHQYSFPTSMPGYGFENAAQANAAAYSFAQSNSQMQNLAPFSSVMQPYTNALPSNLLASTVQPARESDLPYSPFLATQSMPTKYSTSMSSISGPTLSMPEGVKPSIFSSPQPTPQSLPSTNIATGPALPQHLPLHPYSQPTLPLGHFANMIGYPFLPQSYTYLPYAAAGNSAFHQSPAAVHSAPGIKYSVPQYKNSVSVSSLPQSAAIASGYGGGFGSSTNISQNFNLNPTSSPASTIGYEDLISSQYKDSNHYVPLQQNEGSAMWVPGPGSRTMSTLPGSTFYSFQGQNQPSGFRQGQQPSPYGTLGYPNFYHSQAGASQEHQQTQSDSTLSTSQGPSQQSHQIWQHSY
ncbi:probable GPI-anchored adhesin-like protein PGA55 isoform X2 [Aristolochia californica]|uniref:probable GPI-anchored adhesin-like protein PGA55 isoform X2 n=1 Tax=Aristolochia californica TaxID=171875 RepID=UPI0035DBF0EC